METGAWRWLWHLMERLHSSTITDGCLVRLLQRLGHDVMMYCRRGRDASLGSSARDVFRNFRGKQSSNALGDVYRRLQAARTAQFRIQV